MPKRKAVTLSLFELTALYPTVESVVQYFERVRWNDHPVCAKCDKADKITVLPSRWSGRIGSLSGRRFSGMCNMGHNSTPTIMEPTVA